LAHREAERTLVQQFGSALTTLNVGTGQTITIDPPGSARKLTARVLSPYRAAAQEIEARVLAGGSFGSGIQAGGPQDLIQGLKDAAQGEIVGAFQDAAEAVGLRAGTNIFEAAREDIQNLPGLFGDVFDVLGGALNLDPGRALGGLAGIATTAFGAGIDQGQEIGQLTPAGGNQMVPGTGMSLDSIQVGGQVPSTGNIVRVWDTWPGAGVTGGGRAPVFFRTFDGKTYVRKLDGTVKKVPKTRNIVLNSRKLNLQTYIKAEKYLERITKRIAKSTRGLKRA